MEVDAIGFAGDTDHAHGVERVGGQRGVGGQPGLWRRRWMVGGTVALTVAVLVTAITVALTRGDDDESEIRALVQEFATAVETDPFQAATMLCLEEREIFEQTVNPDLVLPESPTKAEVSISEIVVESDVASAKVEPRSGPARRIYFRKENGIWTVCDPASRTP
jgi:hypothetical protein